MTNQQVTGAIKAVQAALDRALKAETGAAYDDLSKQVGDLQVIARETMQAQLEQNYVELVHKLENGASLTGSEQNLLRQLVVGEIKYYLQHQAAIDRWQQELQNLGQTLNRLAENNPAEVESLLQMQAMCRGAKGLIADISFYHREKERLARFEAVAGGPIDAESGQILADVIRGMMTSATM